MAISENTVLQRFALNGAALTKPSGSECSQNRHRPVVRTRSFRTARGALPELASEQALVGIALVNIHSAARQRMVGGDTKICKKLTKPPMPTQLFSNRETPPVTPLHAG